MRIKPVFGKKAPASPRDDDDPWGCVRIPFLTIASYYVLMAIIRHTDGNGSRLDQIICYGAFIVFVVVLLLGAVQMSKESLAEDKAKQRWKAAGTPGEARIVHRDSYPGGSYEDEYGISHRVRAYYRLTLKLPDQITTQVDVKESVYKKLENRHTVRIYYEPESPLTFMLEEEL
jgi:hypothetical protein